MDDRDRESRAAPEDGRGATPGQGAARTPRDRARGRGRDGEWRATPAVLLVDDRAENLLALEAVLEPLGARLVRAVTAEQALQHVDDEDIAVILLDVQMPVTDGLEAARLIKARERGRIVPIIFLTAVDHDRRRVTTAYQAGAVDYLFKPFDPAELCAKVAAFLELHRLHEEDRERRRRYADRLIHSSEGRYREAAEEAERARAAFEAADRTRNEFLSRMSHELRTPLNAILGYIQLLDLGILGTVTPLQHTHLNRVRQSAVHLLGLVNEILDLVTLDPEATGLRVAHELGHVGEACEAALTLVRIEAVVRNLTVVSPAANGPGAAYVGDPDRVRQVLVHLLTNALKFTPPGGTVMLTCGTADEVEPGAGADDVPLGPGPWSYVRVADTGIGITPAYLPHVFEAFMQVDGGRTRAEGGAGLGLAISRRLARAMGGEVTVQSRPGEGSVFTLWLPAPAAVERAAGAGSASPAASTRRGSSNGGGDGDGSAGMTASARAAASDAAPGTPSVTSHRGVAVLGGALANGIEAVTRRYAGRLRADRTLPSVGALPDAQLRDHTSTLVGEIAHVLTVMGQTEGRSLELLRDGSEILRLVSELHGAQRHRLGWSEAHIARELGLLREEIVAALGHAAAGGGDGDREALAQATALVDRLLEQARQTSLRGLRSAQRMGGA